MGRLKLFLSLVAILILVNGCAQQKSGPLEGAWKMVSGTYTDLKTNQEIAMEKTGRFCIKVMSDTHFSVVEMFKENPDSLFFAAVGTYQLTDDHYVETYQASNVGYQIGTSREFVYNLEGDRWTIMRSQEDMELRETWVKVEQR